jgi:hypothetical protein
LLRILLGLEVALDQLEVLKQPVGKRREGRLVVEDQPKRVEIGALLSPRSIARRASAPRAQPWEALRR